MGPLPGRPCGIADYVRDLAAALAPRCDLFQLDYEAASEAGGFDALLVHYEANLVPDRAWLEYMGLRHPHKVYLVPHEVYAEDPFAFPYAQVRSPWPPALWAKRWLYRRRHEAFFRELDQQAHGYHAHRVIPLSQGNARVLAAAGAANLLPVVPHACWEPPPASGTGAGERRSRRAELFGGSGGVTAGVFGFLTPANDYDTVFSALRRWAPEVRLLLLGGERTGGGFREKLLAAARDSGLEGRVKVTGHIAGEWLWTALGLCDLLLCPFRFRSNSGSLLRLAGLGKPVVAARIPLTEELSAQGAPLYLYDSEAELGAMLARAAKRELKPLPNRYPYSFDRVAEMYLDRMNLSISQEEQKRP